VVGVLRWVIGGVEDEIGGLLGFLVIT